jgi:hypothetical protein
MQDVWWFTELHYPGSRLISVRLHCQEGPINKLEDVQKGRRGGCKRRSALSLQYCPCLNLTSPPRLPSQFSVNQCHRSITTCAKNLGRERQVKKQ